MAKFGVQIRGGTKLRAEMRKAGVDVKLLTAANRAAAETVAGAGRGLAPVGQPRRKRGRGRPKSGGALRASIRTKANQRTGTIVAGNARVPYANVQHWGWPKRSIRPKYFLSTAATSTEPVWVRNYEKHINDILKQVKGAK